METTPAPVRQGRTLGIVVTLALMLLSFTAGAFVGIHPEWIPNMPWAYQPKNDQLPETTMHIPTSQPTGETQTDSTQNRTAPSTQQ